MAAHYGCLSAVLVGQPFPIRKDWLSGRAFTEQVAVNVGKLGFESCTDFDNERAGNNQTYRSALTVPLVSKGQALGVIAMRRREAQPFTVKEGELLRYLAESSVDKLEIDWLIMDTEEKNYRLPRHWSNRRPRGISCASLVVRPLTWSRCWAPLQGMLLSCAKQVTQISSGWMASTFV